MEKKVIRKIQISYDNQSFRDFSLINGEIKEFDHAFSNPWEISIETRDEMSVDKKADIRFLIEGNRYFEASVFVSIDNINENSGIRDYTLKGISDILPCQSSHLTKWY
ncbi:hypothetical protein D1B33_03540 [Lysinibacillus yapensis]|uniref:Uncharacterized protein n=1 Tax=Ureibacillus yapensis TaxID=2304605 RepID=A0A396STW8_9BACL|nr:hypothetical protein [Lysinibacillus yapensis]RHW39931.1 hypothetical protein D1B33_03540 [Lysinibacillus yapensis]